jgi:copper chaperone CopZ
MIRRQFIQLATLAGVSGLTAIGAVKAGETKTVTYHVKGFSCITCAVGLDTMLVRHKGIFRSKSTYPEGIVTIDFHPSLITESSIKGLISEIGFTVEG